MMKRWMMKKSRWSILLLAGLALSCSKTYESSIPYRQVNLQIDLTFEDKELKSPQAYKIFIQGRHAGELTGFGGILVYHGIDAYYAFDAACPYEANKNTLITLDEAGIYAYCPQCHSKYNLWDGGAGNPVSGPAQYGLKPYPLFIKGNKIYVQN